MGKASRQSSRERLREERQKSAQRAKRNKVLAVAGAALAVIVLIVGGGYLYLSSERRAEQEFADQYASLPPQALQDDGSVVLAREGASAPVVEVYADYQCPACRQFEIASGPTLQRLATEGRAIVHYRPVSIFAQQPAPLSANSLRGGAAARAAADQGKYVEYNDILFDNQPAEGSAGFSASDLKQWGKDAGIEDTAAFDERVDSENDVVERFTGSYSQELISRAQEAFSAEQLQGMSLSEIIAWGNDNGVDGSFLDGTYVNELIQATAAVGAKYSSGADKFDSTPSVYVDGAKLGNDAFSGNGIEKAVESAGPGEVDTRPLAADDSAVTEVP
ncbi:DsbA family protein [Nocardiopsis mangrovi]|uniref:DsbA family protein n=1 Tax=Nocardiopsis mangrovi TaxID=1179818 RepID=A0ABV9DSL3_9ACTN